MTGTGTDLLDALAVAERVGISYRQLDCWTRSALVHAVRVPSARAGKTSGSGVRRAYAAAEVEVLAVMARLVAAGVTPPAAARAARNGLDLGDGVRIVLDAERRPAMRPCAACGDPLPDHRPDSRIPAVHGAVRILLCDRCGALVGAEPPIVPAAEGVTVDAPV